MRSVLALFVLAACMPIPAQESASSATSPHQALLHRYEELGRRGQHAVQTTFWSADAINNGRPMRPDLIGVILEDIYRTFPDYNSETLETIERGDVLVSMSRVTGTHLGVAQTTFNGGLLKDATPTGKRFEVLQTHWWKFKDDKIIWHQGVRDDLGMLRQLGLVPDELPASLRESVDTADQK